MDICLTPHQLEETATKLGAPVIVLVTPDNVAWAREQFGGNDSYQIVVIDAPFTPE